VSKDERPVIRGLVTGIPGFDMVLGGGLPEFSFNLVAGGPGSGKTTLANQVVFANATRAKPALYFTVLGEPTLKMLRYQRQFSFFDPKVAGDAVQFINLTEEVSAGNLSVVLEKIIIEVERTKPGIVVVDSFRTIVGRVAAHEDSAMFGLDRFIQRLALHLTSWEVTSFLLGEYGEEEQRNPIFTVADGIFWLSQATDRNSVVRKVQIVKARGRAPMPGLHTFRITNDGLEIFPRIPEQASNRVAHQRTRQSTGIRGLDEMTCGGVVSGHAIMLSGPAGSGKSTVASQFMVAGLKAGESGVIAVFEEYPEEYLARANARDPEIGKMIRSGKLEVIYLRPLDLSVDETLHEILKAVTLTKARRVVIDSLSGFEVALAPTFREDFRESLYRLVGTLTATGVTVFMTAEVVEGFSDVRFTAERVSFITDEIIIQRYIELEGELRRVMAVIKMRGSDHSHELRTYEINPKGVTVGDALTEYDGIMTGVPALRNASGSARKGGAENAKPAKTPSKLQAAKRRK
jgi:circadian clock protein KaiC